MKVTWLGQAGLLFQTDAMTIMIDPYLSDSVAAVNPLNARRKAVDERFFAVRPDVMIFTHNHLDHYDPETVSHFLGETSGITVLAPWSVWKEVRKYGGNNNYVLFNRRTSWTQDGILFTAVKAEHSDEYAIGVIIEVNGKNYYVTGDTLYNEDVFADIPQEIFAVFLPVNGVGNNMNTVDAKRFVQRVKAQKAVPVHFGLFDDIRPDGFGVIPEIYKEIDLTR